MILRRDNMDIETEEKHMARVMMYSCGGTRRELTSFDTYEEALAFCEDNHWVFDAGYIWDLEIEEE